MDFSLILFLLTVVTGVISLVYRLFSKKQITASEGAEVQTNEPVIVEYARALFPVFLIVFTLRSFVIEPFRIPSGSMIPSLHVGDFILVNKFSYGVRLPVLNKKVIDMDDPARGDVMVFRSPEEPHINFIKRVVGIPGDTLVYKNKQLYINEKLAQTRDDGFHTFVQGNNRGKKVKQLLETFDNSEHTIIVSEYPNDRPQSLFYKGATVTVPEGHYFMMGDNRDGSNDSRYWGFVPEENIVGKAFFIWLNLNHKKNFSDWIDWSRIGNSIN